MPDISIEALSAIAPMPALPLGLSGVVDNPQAYFQDPQQIQAKITDLQNQLKHQTDQLASRAASAKDATLDSAKELLDSATQQAQTAKTRIESVLKGILSANLADPLAALEL